jgi:vitamin B12 transporter
MSMIKKLLALPALATSLFASAQDTTKVAQLERVIITATKFPIKENQTGKVITVITKEQLEKSIGKTIGQVLNEQAGITVNGALNNLGSEQSVYTRGAASGRTLIAIDGIPVSDPSLIDNEFDLNLVPIDNIEHIEICKGAQSTLYGSDAIAGVINIITAKTDCNKPFNLKATLAGGNYGTYKGNAQVFGKTKQLLYNVRYSRLATDGFSAAHDESGKNHFDNDAYKSDVFATNIDYSPISQLHIKSFVQYSRYKTDLDASAFRDDKDYTLTSKSLMLGGGVVYKLPSATITGNYRYNKTTRVDLNDSTDGSSLYTDRFSGRTQYAEVFANIDLGHGFTWLQGADYRFAAMNDTSLSISIYGPYGSTDKDTSMSQTSMYSSLLYSNKGGFGAELGGRLNTHSKYGSNYTYTFNPYFLIDKKVKIYGSIATGFKAPSLYQLFSSYGDPSLKPERSTNYVLVIQYIHPKFNTRLTYFNRKIKDGLDFDYNAFKYFNFNEQKAYGLEWENSVQVTSQLSITANYTWLKATEGLESRISFVDTTYKYALRRPEHTVNVTVGFQATKQGFISVSGHYESKRHDIGGYMTPDVPLESYFMLNAYAEWRVNSRLKFFADAKNVTNKKFFDIAGYNSIPFLITGGITLTL